MFPIFPPLNDHVTGQFEMLKKYLKLFTISGCRPQTDLNYMINFQGSLPLCLSVFKKRRKGKALPPVEHNNDPQTNGTDEESIRENIYPIVSSWQYWIDGRN
ncbi:hypothetical protein [uncultured Cohaesibacter sp.]|uniref:hypothetical protein n=1 Tax=uncultured Cohaesibacter sp. TaxID=1002546 RepID=UPI0029C988F0|nr:hypothetical protein [uncultured Cohaesibacter sp.]